MCPHKHTAILTTGDLTFIAGELVDTLQDVLICTDCGDEIPDENTQGVSTETLGVPF